MAFSYYDNYYHYYYHACARNRNANYLYFYSVRYLSAIYVLWFTGTSSH